MSGLHIILSYTDIAAAGSRACRGIDEEADVCPLDIPELADQDIIVTDESDDATEHTVLTIDLKQSKMACIVVNCNIPSNISHQVANTFLDHVISSGVEQLTVVTALRPDPSYTSVMSNVMENCFNCKSAGCAAMPEDFQVQDSFLNALLRLLKVEDIPVRFLVARGYRASKGCPSDSDGSAQTISSLQDALSMILGLKFSKEKTRKLKFSGPDDDEKDIKSMLYL